MITTCAPLDADLLRLRNEYLTMPGLCLTPPQVARLLSIREPRARALLDALVGEGLIIHTVHETYRRALADGFIQPARSGG